MFLLLAGKWNNYLLQNEGWCLWGIEINDLRWGRYVLCLFLDRKCLVEWIGKCLICFLLSFLSPNLYSHSTHFFIHLLSCFGLNHVMRPHGLKKCDWGSPQSEAVKNNTGVQIFKGEMKLMPVMIVGQASWHTLQREWALQLSLTILGTNFSLKFSSFIGWRHWKSDIY